MNAVDVTSKLSLFQGFGVEIEYMIVNKETLDIMPITDRIMHAVSGAYLDEVERGEISWSNELALHVIELKTTGVTKGLRNTYTSFQKNIREINALLSSLNAQLMPTAMHPWMNPLKEMKVWPHGYSPIYEAYNRIFNCTGHGWANLQSSHLNLPFATDAEFAKLHAAIRIALPILPAMAASSPIIEKRLSSLLDMRLDVYRHNAIAIPSITGKIIPEVALSRKDYEENILGKMYRDIAPLDPEHLLQYEWLNSRGAIARFDRYAIEIRVLDTQECPQVDLAILQLIVALIKALVDERWATIRDLNAYDLDALHQLILASIKDGEQAIIKDKNYLAFFGYQHGDATKMSELWAHLCGELLNPTNSDAATQETLRVILEQGPLARRIIRAWQKDQTEFQLHAIYRELCECLEQGRMFRE